MRYFIIAGEASGDLHGSHLMAALQKRDAQAELKFFGGDLMAQAAGHAPVIHYRDMAYMGFIEVAKHLRTIMGFLRTARTTIAAWRPDAVVLIDYPSFNLKVAKFAHSLGLPVYYFISPKVWVWKEWRVKDIKRYVSRMLCILPFEPAWYAQRGFEARYVGNPTVQEIGEATAVIPSREAFCAQHGWDAMRPIIALVPGSRVKEIRDNLPTMLEAARRHPDCQLAIAAAPSIEESLYVHMGSEDIPLLYGQTWPLVRHAEAALVTSGTATLETAVLGTPQVACYRMNGSKWLYKFYRRLLKGKYVTLPNLITDESIIPELLLHHCDPDDIDRHLSVLLRPTEARRAQLAGYDRMMSQLGNDDCTATAAQIIINDLK